MSREIYHTGIAATTGREGPALSHRESPNNCSRILVVARRRYHMRCTCGDVQIEVMVVAPLVPAACSLSSAITADLEIGLSNSRNKHHAEYYQRDPRGDLYI